MPAPFFFLLEVVLLEGYRPATAGSGSSGTGPQTYAETRGVLAPGQPEVITIPTGSSADARCLICFI